MLRRRWMRSWKVLVGDVRTILKRSARGRAPLAERTMPRAPKAKRAKPSAPPAFGPPPTVNLLHAADIERRAGLALDLVDGDAVGQFDELEAVIGHVDHAEVRDDAIHDAHARQRQRAFFENLVLVALRDVFH